MLTVSVGTIAKLVRVEAQPPYHGGRHVRLLATPDNAQIVRELGSLLVAQLVGETRHRLHPGAMRRILGWPADRGALAQCLGNLEVGRYRAVDVDELAVLAKGVEEVAEILERHAPLHARTRSTSPPE